MKSKIAIIGAGYTGMTAAKKLLEQGYEVTIYEKDSQPGGMAKSVDIDGIKIEKYYRHIFQDDAYVISLIKELHLEEKLKWFNSKMGYYIQNKKYRFGQALTLLTFTPLSLIEKIKFGLGILKIKAITNDKELENITAEQWMIQNSGKEVYSKIWEPLLVSKFGEQKANVSMAWLWGKIKLRSSSSKLLTESLGYMKGSFEVLTNKLEEYLWDKGCQIYYNHEVKMITQDAGKWNIGGKQYDAVLSTVAYPITQNIYQKYLTSTEKQKMGKVNYTAARTMILILNRPLTNFYWLNIGEKQMPFGGIIEHTNMIESGNYQNKHIVYISNYMYPNHELYKLSKEELYRTYEPYLKQIAETFDAKDIIKYNVYDERYAQPIIETGYSNDILPFQLESEGLYVATMPQIYPEDRGMNYAIKMGYEVANIMIKTLKEKEKTK